MQGCCKAEVLIKVNITLYIYASIMNKSEFWFSQFFRQRLWRPTCWPDPAFRKRNLLCFNLIAKFWVLKIPRGHSINDNELLSSSSPHWCSLYGYRPSHSELKASFLKSTLFCKVWAIRVYKMVGFKESIKTTVPLLFYRSLPVARLWTSTVNIIKRSHSMSTKDCLLMKLHLNCYW